MCRVILKINCLNFQLEVTHLNILITQCTQLNLDYFDLDISSPC